MIGSVALDWDLILFAESMARDTLSDITGIKRKRFVDSLCYFSLSLAL